MIDSLNSEDCMAGSATAVNLEDANVQPAPALKISRDNIVYRQVSPLIFHAALACIES